MLYIQPAEKAADAHQEESSELSALLFPHSRTVLQELLDTDLSNEAFPFSTHRLVKAAGCTVGQHSGSQGMSSTAYGFVECLHWEMVSSAVCRQVLGLFFLLEKAKNHDGNWAWWLVHGDAGGS